MSNTDKLTPHQRIILMNAIAERDKAIADRDKVIAEKDHEIKHYKRQYEIQVRRKLRERHERSERVKDRIALAVLLLVISAVFVPMMLGALRQLNLWLMMG